MTFPDEFKPEEFKSLVNLGMYGSDFPDGLTMSYITDCLDWLNSEDGKEYLLDAFMWWSDKKPESEPEPVDPTVQMYGFKYSMAFPKSGQISIDKILRDKFEIPGIGPDFGKRLLFVFDNNDHLPVPDSSKRTYGKDGRKFQPGRSPLTNGTTDGQEVYLGIERYANSVTMYYNQLPEDAVEPEPDEEWTRIEWGGISNDPDHDRTWWTDIHGNKKAWSRKWNLPRWMDDKPLQVDFLFSDGQSLYVPDSTTMAMDPNGPKYRNETPGESDPRKMAPKVGAIPDTTPSWVEYRVRS